MSKNLKHNVDRKFEIDSVRVVKLAEAMIEIQIRKGYHPTFSNTSKMVMANLANKYAILSQMKKEVLNGLAKFVGDTILKSFIWKKDSNPIIVN